VVQIKKIKMNKFVKSVTNAINGIAILIREERNAKIHVLALIFAILMGIAYEINMFEWLIISLAASLVFITEAINTAIEKTIDYLTLEKKTALKQIKDLAAGAVLIASFFAIIVALIIFIPRIF